MALWNKPANNGPAIEQRLISSFQSMVNEAKIAHAAFENILDHLSRVTYDVTQARDWAKRFYATASNAVVESGGTLEQDVADAIVKEYAPKAIRETPQT